MSDFLIAATTIASGMIELRPKLALARSPQRNPLDDDKRQHARLYCGASSPLTDDFPPHLYCMPALLVIIAGRSPLGRQDVCVAFLGKSRE